jgi:hypothetical protein
MAEICTPPVVFGAMLGHVRIPGKPISDSDLMAITVPG